MRRYRQYLRAAHPPTVKPEESCLMDAENQTCHACGSRCVVSGRLGGTTEFGRTVAGDLISGGFVLSDVRRPPWWHFPGITPGPVVPIRQHGSAKLCLECGTLVASLTADVKDAKKLVDTWASDALKARLDSGDGAV